MKVVAFGHRSRVGKDTAAKMLVTMLRTSGRYKCVQKRSFAAALKDSAERTFRHYGLKSGDFYEEPENEHLRKVKLPGIDLDPVDLWIGMGKKMREIYPKVWLDAVLMPSDCDVVVVSDLRFINEAEAVHKAGGYCARIEKADVLEWRGADHELKDWPGFDATIVNDGTLNQLRDKVEAFANERGLL